MIMINFSKWQKHNCLRKAKIRFIALCTQINRILNRYTLINFLKSQNSKNNFLYFLNSPVLRSCKPLSYKKAAYKTAYANVCT